MSSKFYLIIISCFTINTFSQSAIFPGADENTPSKAQYFSWINNTNEGPTEAQTLINFDFFAWLKSQYGMQLDIYAFDAGTIDGKRFYGSTNSPRFKKQFPNHFKPVYQAAKNLGFRLGIWGGPDGFGDTPEEAQARIDEMVGLCKDYEFALFKFDAVCGPLRPEKIDTFIEMMKACRTYSPDLILLNHRLGLGKAEPYATTFLWGGNETYIDVFMTNNTTAPHHRAAALSRGLVPDLKRLTEDCGVCLSSCLDYWDDDLVLQTFNRNLILSPEIYGNPWLLRDDEYSKLAKIYNLHKQYANILVHGITLPASEYGEDAVSRGDAQTRIISIKNLSWTPKNYTLSLGTDLGLEGAGKVKLIQLHPNDDYLGEFDFNSKKTVSVAPFRAALFLVTTAPYSAPLLKGSAYEVVRDVANQPVLIDVIGDPGTQASVSLEHDAAYSSATLSGKNVSKLVSGKPVKLSFSGTKLKYPVHRQLSAFSEIDIPKDAESLYEATVFSADNNALEVRSLARSGATQIPQVQAARDAFFNQDVFIARGLWDKNLFDGDFKTGFWPSHKYDIDQRVKGGALRIDLGKVTAIDELIMYVPDDFSLVPLLRDEANYVEVSTDLKTWKTITYLAGTEMHISINDNIRYLRFKEQPKRIMEIEGLYKGKKMDSSLWRASNLFAYPSVMKPVKAWQSTFVLPELASQSYLSVALNGKHGVEGAYVAAKIGGELIGAPDRAVSYPSNTWEYVNATRASNYTYYIPMKPEYIGKPIEVFVMAYDEKNTAIKPEVWISSFNDGKEKVRLTLERR